MTDFFKFPLVPSLQATLKGKGFDQATEIQQKLIPRLLAGESVVGVAETGSGKTLSYVLPILSKLKDLENAKDPVIVDAHPRAAVIVPTRELGEQVSKVFKLFTHETRLRVRTVLGGTALDVAKRNVSGPFEVLVATPGRLLQLLERRLVNLSDLRILVFDEADQMLDQGFLPDAKLISNACPAEKQMILLSATVSASVQDLINQLFSKAAVFRSEGSHRVPAKLKTVNRFIKDGKRFPVLETLLKDKVDGGTLIFANTRDQCDKVAAELSAIGQRCGIYRGEMDKQERRNNLKAFRDGKINILISTDLASRGLDVEHVGRVINYHLPKEMENYIHRVGRTARAGRSGVVYNFVTERDEGLVKRLDSIQAPSPKPKKPRS